MQAKLFQFDEALRNEIVSRLLSSLYLLLCLLGFVPL